MANNDQTSLESVLSILAARHAAETAQAVRAFLGRLIGTSSEAPAVTVGTPKAAAAAAASPPPAKPKKSKGPKKGYKRRAITEGELRSVLNVIAKKPGLTSVEIQKEAGIDAKQAARVLGKLREKKAVKWDGDRSKATYRVA